MKGDKMILDLTVGKGDSSFPFQFKVNRMINAGYVGRDIKAVKAHIEELAKEGVPAPPEVPMVFPVLSHNITTAEEIEVIGDKTSGEAEFVLLLNENNIYVGVGSDHTDREVETVSIIKSKQICPNVLSKTVWNYDDIKRDWDTLMLQSWVKPIGSDDETLYQSASLETIISPEDIIELIRSKLTDNQMNSMVIFSGTVPFLTDEMICGHYFRSEIFNKKTGGRLTCAYHVKKMTYLENAG